MQDLQLEIEDFGPIHKANINIGKLNIVGGVNASGKSTASKLLYCFLLAGSPEGEKIYFEDCLLQLCESFKSVSHDLNKNNLLIKGNKEISEIYENLVNLMPENYEEISVFENSHDYEISDEYKTLNRLNEILQNLYDLSELLGLDKKKLNNIFNDLNSNTKKKFLAMMNKIFFREFVQLPYGLYLNFLNQDIVNHIFTGGSYIHGITSIKGKSDNNDEFCWKYVLNDISENSEHMDRSIPTKFDNDIMYDSEDFIFNNDIYYIGPMSSIDSVSKRDHATLPYQFILISKKISDESKLEEANSNIHVKKILEQIEGFVGGNFQLNGDLFQFEKDNSSFNLRISASGIKQIGILQMLLSNGQLKENDYLIIDEPEVNLHPEWQIELAEVLVLLVKELNINLYINSHSPHFIEALEVFSVKYDIDDDTRFYMTSPYEETGKFDFVELDYDNIDILYDNLGSVFDIINKVRIENMMNRL